MTFIVNTASATKLTVKVNGYKQEITTNISNGDMRDILIKNFIPSGSSSDDKIIAKLVRRIKK